MSLVDKQLQAVAETQASLDQIDKANVYGFVQSAHLREALEHALGEPLNDGAKGEYQVQLTEPIVTVDAEDIRVSADFEARWLEPETKRTRVAVAGNIAVHGVPTVVGTADEGFALGVRVTGDRFHLSRLSARNELGWWWWLLERQVALDMASKIVNWTMERINGQIQDAGFPLKLAPMELLAEHVATPDGSLIDITDGKAIVMKVRIEPAAVAVDRSGLVVVGELASYSEEPPKPRPLPPVVPPGLSTEEKKRLLDENYNRLRNGIDEAARSFAEPFPSATSVTVKKEALAGVINDSLANVDRCAKAEFSPPKEQQNFEIPMPKIDLQCSNLDKIDCSTDERCFTYFRRLAESNYNMDCDHEETFTEEKIKDAACCAVAPSSLSPCCRKVTETIIRTVVDLVCEGTKTVARTFVDTQAGIEAFAEKIGQKQLLDTVCRADNFKDKLFCESVKGISGALCDTTQLALNNAWSAGEAIGGTGLIGWKVGDGDAGIKVDGKGKACLESVSVASDLSSFSANASLEGRADVKDSWLHFKPTAYGTAVVGCTEVTLEAKDFSVILVEAPGRYRGSIAADQCTDPQDGAAVACLKVRLDEEEFKLKVDPEPVEVIISQNWDDLALKCAWPTAGGFPPVPFALSAAWVLNHYQDVKQVVGGDRQYFYVKQRYAPQVDPILLRQKVTRWDDVETNVAVEWRDRAIVSYVEDK